jgi:AraC-like DNA-binding protein
MTPLLASADVSIDRVATALDSSARSVQRRLQTEGTSFQRVLDDTRKELALEYLDDPTKPIAEVALLLGFSDQTAFHRAFVRWTGRTPGDVRRRR